MFCPVKFKEGVCLFTNDYSAVVGFTYMFLKINVFLSTERDLYYMATVCP